MHAFATEQSLAFHVDAMATPENVFFVSSSGKETAFPAIVQLDEPQRSYDRGFGTYRTGTLMFEANRDPGLVRNSTVKVAGVRYQVDRVSTEDAGNKKAYIARRESQGTTSDGATNRGR